MGPRSLSLLVADLRGTMAVETAVVAPVLLVLSLGTFEVGTMVSRQHELQSAASEAEAIALAANQGAETSTEQIGTILKKSLGLDAEQVSIKRYYRCGAEAELTEDIEDCRGEEDDPDDDLVPASYIEIDLDDTYTPVWVGFGVGSPFNYNVTRMVQLS